MDDPTIERTSLSHVSHSCADIYVKKPFHFFKLFNLFLPQVYCQLRESKRRKRDFMIFANLSEKAQLHFLRKNVFGFVRNFIIHGAQIRDISFVKSMTNGLNKYAIGRIKVRWNRFDLALSYKRDIRMVTMATGGASLRLLPIRNVDVLQFPLTLLARIRIHGWAACGRKVRSITEIFPYFLQPPKVETLNHHFPIILPGLLYHIMETFNDSR